MGRARDRVQLGAAAKRQAAAAARRTREARRASARSAASRARAARSRTVDEARHGAYLKRNLARFVKEGEPWAVAQSVEDGIRETNWLSNPFDVGPSKRELLEALNPARHVRRHAAKLRGRLVKVRAYRRRYPRGSGS